MNDKVQDNQSDPEHCSFILLKFGYNNQYILPIEDGLNMIRSLAKSRRFVDDYDKPNRVETKIDQITIGFLSKMDINEIQVKAALQK
jgi:hypothetical protein